MHTVMGMVMGMVIHVFKPSVKTFYAQFHMIPLESSKGWEHLKANIPTSSTFWMH